MLPAVSAARTAWSYAARTYASIGEGWAKTGYQEPSLADVPRLVCATLLFLRAAHEAHVKEKGLDIRALEPKDMVAFVQFAKNAIIHGPERISLVAGPLPPGITPPAGVKLAFAIRGFEIDFEGPDAYRSGDREAAERYATRRASRGVVGGLLAEVWDAVLETAEMLDVPDAERRGFEATGIPTILPP